MIPEVDGLQESPISEIKENDSTQDQIFIVTQVKNISKSATKEKNVEKPRKGRRKRKILPTELPLETILKTTGSYETTIQINTDQAGIASSQNQGMKSNSEPIKFACQFCERKYSSQCDLKKHIKFHENPELFKCKICEYQATLMSSLKNHLRARHLNREMNLKCDRCDYKSDLKGSLKVHMRIHVKFREMKLICHQCGYKTDNKGHFNRHMKNTHESLNKKLKNSSTAINCEKCPSACRWHFRRKHGKSNKAQCDLCGKEFSAKGTLLKHFKTIHKIHISKPVAKEKILEKRQKIGRNQAGIASRTRGQAEKKNDSETKKFTCYICEKEYSHRYKLTRHMQVHENHEEFKCQICGHQAKRKHSFKQHMKIHEENRKKKWKCNGCGYKTDRKAYLKIHLKFHEEKQNEENSSTAINCEFCPSVLKNLKVYRVHLVQTHGSNKKAQ
jgi:KRAB domain-containing zinc finger protein